MDLSLWFFLLKEFFIVPGHYSCICHSLDPFTWGRFNPSSFQVIKTWARSLDFTLISLSITSEFEHWQLPLQGCIHGICHCSNSLIEIIADGQRGILKGVMCDLDEEDYMHSLLLVRWNKMLLSYDINPIVIIIKGLFMYHSKGQFKHAG